MGRLITGPAGAGKSSRARDLLKQAAGPTAIVDFQSVYAALLLLKPGPDGRYGERDPSHAHLLALAEYVRRAAITGAREMDIDVIATNSDGSPARRNYLLGLLGAGAVEEMIDPGRDVVEQRLSVNGVLSEQCGKAIDRFYGGLPNG